MFVTAIQEGCGTCSLYAGGLRPCMCGSQIDALKAAVKQNDETKLQDLQEAATVLRSCLMVKSDAAGSPSCLAVALLSETLG